MGRTAALIGFTCAMMITAAHADVSDNLVFCSKLGNSRERIACYDAAARIAANPTPRTERSIANRELISRTVADAPVVYQDGPPRSRFEGFYVAAGGGYGVTGPRTVEFSGTAFFNPGLADTVYSHGWSVTGAAGYNIIAGRWLFGLELDGRFSDERGGRVQVTTFTPPSLSTGTETLSYAIKSDGGVHLSARVGAVFENTLAFAKIGLGASHITETAVSDGSGVATCLALQCPPGVPFASVRRGADKAAWVPSLLFGVGLEQNFGSLFIRAQGELEAAQLQKTDFALIGNATSDVFWTARAMAAVGLRF